MDHNHSPTHAMFFEAIDLYRSIGLNDDLMIKVDSDLALRKTVKKWQNVYTLWLRSRKINDVERAIREDVTLRKMDVKDKNIVITRIKRTREL